ncbi:centriolar and ciliogenesis-associated protein hyls-1-like isoform X3 [Bacillus rossius redtenbacheri]|uniref:centriolar and ciliogenesis-associated protein hyls-1-like isoform X3 n=1 Tax=Bacillus rossius redtenbacheri TaxID=93214 RepID=UPI002FDCDEDE
MLATWRRYGYSAMLVNVCVVCGLRAGGMSVHLDPQEVLCHLQQLGFSDVSPKQLAEFMRDLKRLISYDRQRQCLCRCTCEGEHSSVSGSERGTDGQHLDAATISLADRDENMSELESLAFSSTHAPSKSVMEQPKRIKSTLIRPWQAGQGAARRCDPVALYHRYRALWSQQKFPGEDGRAELRWTVRHRMLGRQHHVSVPFIISI